MHGKNTILEKRWLRALVCGALSLALVLGFSKLSIAKWTDESASAEAFTAHLDIRVSDLMSSYDIPGVSMALISQGEMVWSKAYGFADIQTDRHMTTDTCCRVQSISKPVTAFGVMTLAEQGLIDLDSPVAAYITSWEAPDERFSKVTIRQLLCHKAGLTLGDVMDIYAPEGSVPTLRENLSRLTAFYQAPGTSFSYSNTSFNLLELLVEDVTGQDFAAYMHEQILLPLGMRYAHFDWSVELDVPVGYSLPGNAVPAYVYPEKGSGGLFATAEDIAAFAIAGMPNFNGGQSILNAASINQLYVPHAHDLGVYSLVFDAYGLGYYIESLPGGHFAVSHGGQGTGIMTHLHFVPETGDGIVILTNSQRSWPFIAYILRDWAGWGGFSPVGMERIIWGQYALWGLMALLWFFTLMSIWKAAMDIVAGRRRFTPLARQHRFLRMLECGLCAVIAAVLIWSASQPYLFISSIFPVASLWLFITAFPMMTALLTRALFPKVLGKEQK